MKNKEVFHYFGILFILLVSSYIIVSLFIVYGKDNNQEETEIQASDNYFSLLYSKEKSTLQLLITKTFEASLGQSLDKDKYFEYLMVYQSDSKTSLDGIQGRLQNKKDEYKDLYIGTCSDKDCVSDLPRQGIIKLRPVRKENDQAPIFQRYFIIKEGKLILGDEGIGESFTLTKKEESWFKNPVLPDSTDENRNDATLSASLTPQVPFEVSQSYYRSPPHLHSHLKL